MQIKVVTRYTTLQKISKKPTRQLPKDIENINTAGLVIKTNFVKTWSGKSHTKW